MTKKSEYNPNPTPADDPASIIAKKIFKGLGVKRATDDPHVIGQAFMSKLADAIVDDSTNNIAVEVGSGNVFEDLGFENPDLELKQARERDELERQKPWLEAIAKLHIAMTTLNEACQDAAVAYDTLKPDAQRTAWHKAQEAGCDLAEATEAVMAAMDKRAFR